jgi:glycosyltransferase involved in cell wall biosynthesis
LEALDNPDPGATVALRRELLERNGGTPTSQAAAMAEEEADTVIHRVHDRLRALGSEGRIVASGLYVGTGLRQAIPNELWAAATVDFGAGSLVWKGLVYHNVELATAAPDIESIVAAMSAWLGKRREERGDEPKQILRHVAREEFREAFSVRTFNEAYAACYRRTRGRPQK